MKVEEFDYELPESLIAQKPVEPRDGSRLMVVDRLRKTWSHKCFSEIVDILRPTDVLVFNDSKVFPARLLGNKLTGGKVELLLVKEKGPSGWEAISRPGLKPGQIARFDKLEFRVETVDKSGVMVGNFNVNKADIYEILDDIGYTPLPPYIHGLDLGKDPKIRQRYQTVYANKPGSAAAPTAGLHFTNELLKRLTEKGIGCEFLTLQVGWGTFAPIKEEMVENHIMHSEWYEVEKETGARILEYKREGRRIVAVGTTSVRTLESWFNSAKEMGETKIFIYPGYKFQIVDAMITNFHLPKSSLIMLVAAFASRELILNAYRDAVKEKYRFFSFGDAMLIE